MSGAMIFEACVGEKRRVTLAPRGPFRRRVHVFTADDVEAVDMALAAGRSLLLRGEPGCGKTQMAEAVATALDVPFESLTVNGRTEAADLFYTVDAVRRLAEAQLQAAAGAGSAEHRADALAKLELRNFVKPGPLWWGLDASSALRCGIVSPDHRARYARSIDKALPPCVVLIDEIDKADLDLPHALLEILGSWAFDDPTGQRIALAPGEGAPGSARPPLVILSTNEEKELPAAFVRRCLEHRIEVPEGNLEAWLVERGAANFEALGEKLLKEAAGDLRVDREAARQRSAPPPGLAEYLDVLRILEERGGTAAERKSLLKRARRFVFGKHQGGASTT